MKYIGVLKIIGHTERTKISQLDLLKKFTRQYRADPPRKILPLI